jgi:hypothetical protein
MASIIFVAEDNGRLGDIRSVADIDRFDSVELLSLTTLDFQTIVSSAGLSWAAGAPILYEPDGGVAIFKVDELALQHVLGKATQLTTSQQADVRRLADFVARHGADRMYEFATF